MGTHPQPFTWHQSAEEILDRLAGCCRSLNKAELARLRTTMDREVWL